MYVKLGILLLIFWITVHIEDGDSSITVHIENGDSSITVHIENGNSSITVISNTKIHFLIKHTVKVYFT